MCDGMYEEVKTETTYEAASALALEPATWGLRVRVLRWLYMEALSDRESDMKREWYVDFWVGVIRRNK